MKEVDPIEELHQIRQKMYKKAGGTPTAFVRYLMEKQKEYAGRLVDLSKPSVSENKPRRKPAKPVVAKTASRKPKQRRKTVAP